MNRSSRLRLSVGQNLGLPASIRYTIPSDMSRVKAAKLVAPVPVAANNHRRILMWAALAAFLFKVFIAYTTFGTNDVLTFERMLQKVEKHGVVPLYGQGTPVTVNGFQVGSIQMNHPPLVLTMLEIWGGFRDATGLPLGFWMRLTCAIADLFVVWLLWRVGMGEGDNWRGLLALALAPAAIMISGFHGNTDPIMIAFVVLAACLMDKKEPDWLVGVVFGLACSIKASPLVLFPVFLLNARTTQRRVQFCVGMGVMSFLAALPWVLHDPELIARSVLGYTPMGGWWGMTYIWPDIGQIMKIPLFICCVGAALYMDQRVRSIYAQCAVVIFLFMFLAPGFGPQYIAWILPWTIAAGWLRASAFQLVAGIFLFGMYNAWCQGLPWNFADANKNPIPTWVFQVGLLAWALLPLMMLEAYRRYKVDLYIAPLTAAPATLKPKRQNA
jgi:hypothetical protein